MLGSVKHCPPWPHSRLVPIGLRLAACWSRTVYDALHVLNTFKSQARLQYFLRAGSHRTATRLYPISLLIYNPYLNVHYNRYTKLSSILQPLAMSTFDNFDRLAMSEAQFLRMAETEIQAVQRPQLRRGPSFAEKYLWKSPSLGTASTRHDTFSPSASPALSTTSSFSSPKMNNDAYFGPSSVTSPSIGSGWGLGLVFRKRSGTNASAASSPSIGGRQPTLGAQSPNLGSSNVQEHKRSGSTSSGGSRDEFGLA